MNNYLLSKERNYDHYCYLTGQQRPPFSDWEGAFARKYCNFFAERGTIVWAQRQRMRKERKKLKDLLLLSASSTLCSYQQPVRKAHTWSLGFPALPTAWSWLLWLSSEYPYPSPTGFQVLSITRAYLGQPPSKLHLGIALVPLLTQIPVGWSSVQTAGPQLLCSLAKHLLCNQHLEMPFWNLKAGC